MNKKLINKLLTGMGVLVMYISSTGFIFDEKKPKALSEYKDAAYTKLLTAETIDKSIDAAGRFLLNCQKPEGNFNLKYNLATKKYIPIDTQVSQVQALWGLVLFHNHKPGEDTLPAIVKGLSYFRKNSKTTESTKFITYPGARSGRTGTTGLIVMTLIEFLSKDNHIYWETIDQLGRELDKYMSFLISLRMRYAMFLSSYDLNTGEGFGDPSAVYDGQSLLALAKACKYAGYGETEGNRILIKKSGNVMHSMHADLPIMAKQGDPEAKDFFNWAAMAYYELYTSGWNNVEIYAERAIETAKWLIDDYKILEKTDKNAQNYEGLIAAWELARLTGDKDSMIKIGYVIDRSLHKMISRQINGPIKNKDNKKYETDDTAASGGFVDSKNGRVINTDTTVRQIHSLILARTFIYKVKSK